MRQLGIASTPDGRVGAAPVSRTSMACASIIASPRASSPVSTKINRVERGGPVPMPKDQRFVFSRRDRELSVFIQWGPQAKRDAMGRIALYDADHRSIARGTPVKLRLRPGEYSFTTWTLLIGGLPAGIYRVDLLLDEAPAWRGYVRITD